MRRPVGLAARMLLVVVLLPVLGAVTLVLAGVALVLPLGVLTLYLAVIAFVAVAILAVVFGKPFLVDLLDVVAVGPLGVLTVLFWTLFVTRLLVLVGPGVYHELTGDSAVLKGLDATTSPEEYPALVGAVDRYAQQFSLPVPTLSVVDTSTPEAFTVGYRPSTTTLVVSTGLLDVLDDTEIEAVVAHELAHVRNRDATVMTLATLPLAATRRLTRAVRCDGPDERGSTNRAGPLGYDLVHTLFLIWRARFLLYLVTLPVGFLGRVLVSILSRARETAADRAAAAATGDPTALASALEKLDDDLASKPVTDLRARRAVAAMSIVAPDPVLLGWFPYFRRWLARNVYHTHPPTEQRIERLREFVVADETA